MKAARSTAAGPPESQGLGCGLGLSSFATLICNNRLSLENTRSARGHGGSGRGARWGHCASRVGLLESGAALEVATWLILPVVIRSSQRLSHARLSKSNFTVKLRMAHYISYSLLDSTLLLGYP